MHQRWSAEIVAVKDLEFYSITVNQARKRLVVHAVVQASHGRASRRHESSLGVLLYSMVLYHIILDI